MWSKSERRLRFRLSHLARLAVVLVLAGTAACGSPEIAEPAADPLPPTSAAVTDAGDAARGPEDSAPEVSAPTTPVAEVSAPEASVPTTSVAEAEVVEVSVPTTSVAEVAASEVSVPTTSVPEVSVPEVSVPDVVLPVAAEYGSRYDRDDWGPHNSDICRGAVGSADPYTGTPIDTCNVDHVVALHEAHESGGWNWPATQKQRFSQDPDNHVASRACVNQSKGADDIFEWSDSDIASSSACGGGYAVTLAGRCFLAVTTVVVKSEWGLAVDQAEAEALTATLANCGDQAPEVSTAPQGTSTAAVAPTTTTEVAERCVIANRTEAQYDAVSGIGEVLSARLVAAQPFSSRADLESVRGIGPVKAEAVWSHFCGP